MEVGIVGLPNVGKSTIFNILTKAGAEVANYPFCTIDPNIGIVSVPDERLDYLQSVYKPKKEKPVYATIKFFDIAGLVKGASKGEGLGNKFLSNIKQVDAIAEVVRTFSDKNIIHTSNKIDPLSDIEVINTELMLSDMEILNNNITKVEKLAKQNEKEYKLKYEILLKIKNALDEGVLINNLNLSEDEKKQIQEYNFLTIKPILYVFNSDENDLNDFEKKYPNLVEYVKKLNSKYVVISAKIEEELSALSEKEKQDYIKELGGKYDGFKNFIKEAYNLLDLINFFTVGDDECRAWSVPKGITASKAAGKIHTDLEKGFIRAEIMAYDDFVKYGSEAAVKEAGKLRLEGKDYIIKDGDIMYVRFNK